MEEPQPPLLRLEEIEQRPKQVLLVEGFADRIGLHLLPPQYEQDFRDLQVAILGGAALPAGFYRRGKGKYDDAALQQYGLMHLHLGGQSSDVLLFLFQFPDEVVFLEINNHTPFNDLPPGRTVRNRWYAPALVAIAEGRTAMAEARKQAAEAAKAKNADIRARLNLPGK